MSVNLLVDFGSGDNWFSIDLRLSWGSARRNRLKKTEKGASDSLNDTCHFYLLCLKLICCIIDQGKEDFLNCNHEGNKEKHFHLSSTYQTTQHSSPAALTPSHINTSIWFRHHHLVKEVKQFTVQNRAPATPSKLIAVFRVKRNWLERWRMWEIQHVSVQLFFSRKRQMTQYNA